MLVTPSEESHYWPKHVRQTLILLLNLLHLMDVVIHSRISHHTILPDFLLLNTEDIQRVDKIMEILRD
jgi:hypothetical protein